LSLKSHPQSASPTSTLYTGSNRTGMACNNTTCWLTPRSPTSSFQPLNSASFSPPSFPLPILSSLHSSPLPLVCLCPAFLSLFPASPTTQHNPLHLPHAGNVTVKWHTSQTFMPSLLDVLSRPASEQEEGNGTAATAQHRDRAASILLGRTRKRATAGLMLCSLASMHSHCPPNSSMDYPSRPSVVRRKAMARLLRRRFMSSASEACTDRVRAHLDAQPKDIAETLLWVLVLPPTQEECNEITGPPREGSKVRRVVLSISRGPSQRCCAHTRESRPHRTLNLGMRVIFSPIFAWE
jgi:hypothetical protein